jgi:hypothetical protein
MTVRADDLALLDLLQHVFPPTCVDGLTDVELLVAQVVELEDDGIRLSALDARVEFEVIDQELCALAC